jgi:hypothetical protein
MAYDFLGLVNDVNRRLNEVELTSTNFNTAIGFYAHAKDAVNWAIRSINQVEFEWPFNHSTVSLVLTPGTARYAFPADMKSVAFDSFRVVRDDTLGNQTQYLHRLDYEEYLQKLADDEENTANTSIRGLPHRVFRTPDFKFGVNPIPDKAYTLKYEYYKAGTDLVNAADVPTIPVAFRHIINEGAMAQAYLFRSNLEASEISQRNFYQGIKNMRGILINRYDYARSTMRV